VSWGERRERSNRAAIRFARRLTLVLPRRVGRWLLFPTTLYFLLAASSARAASRQFLSTVLPRAPRLRDIFRHFHSFATVVMDRAYLVRGRLDEYEIEITGAPSVQALQIAGRGGFLVGAHLGSFEVSRAMGRELAQPPRVAMVMFEDNARMISEALAMLNPGLQQEIIGLGATDSMIKVKHAIDAGALAGILADRLPAGDWGYADDRRVLSFHGRPAAFPVGPFRMAALLKRPAVLMLGLYLGGNRYRLVFEELYDFRASTGDRQAAIDDALQRYVRRLEHYSRAYPFNWFNFYDVWETARPAAIAGKVQPA
jgi:predicted LPLAT superfamily acyltransferase